MAMIISQHLKLYQFSCKLVHCIANLEFDVNLNPRDQFPNVDESIGNVFRHWRHYFSIVIAITYAAQCITAENTTTKMDAVISWSFLGLVMVCQMVTADLVRKPIEIRHYVKALFQVDKILPEHLKNMSLVQNANVLFAYATIPTEIILPFAFAHGLHYGNPCKTTLVGYWLIPSCQSFIKLENINYISTADFMIKFVVILVNHWQWSYMLHTAGSSICIIQTLATTALQQFVHRYELKKNQL